MDNCEKLISIETPHMLKCMIEQCETRCSTQCCGLDAFNFSPLNIAFFFTVNERKPECISKENVRRVKRELVRLQADTKTLKENDYGDIGFLDAIRRPITRKELQKMCVEIEHNIDVARELISDMQRKRYRN